MLFGISGILTFLSSLIFGLFVLLKNPRRLSSRIWFVFTLSVAVWGFGVVWFSFEPDIVRGDFVYRLVYAFGVVWIPVLFLHFVLNFLNLPYYRMLRWAGYAVGAVFALLLFTNQFLAGVKVKFGQLIFIDPGPLHPVFLAWWLGLVVYAHLELLRNYRTAPLERKNQIKYFFLASAIGWVGGSLTYLPGYDIDVYPYGNFAIFLYPIIMAYAIAKHQLMDIQVAIRKALWYSVSVAVLAGVIAALSLLNDWFVSQIPGFRFWFIPVIAGSVAVLIGNLFWRKSKEADRLKYEFITVAAHKLRTPLTEIKWMTEELGSSAHTPVEQNILGRVRIANNRLIELANVLLETAKAENGSQSITYRRAPTDLAAVVSEAIEDYRGQWEEKGIKVSVRAADRLMPVLADPGRIASVIQILMENAIIYSQRGGRIKLEVVQKEDEVIVAIEDSGIGIAKDEMPYLFEKFYRGPRAMLIDTEGTGLGLFIAKTIIDRHGGRMGVESAGPDRGTRVWFALKTASN